MKLLANNELVIVTDLDYDEVLDSVVSKLGLKPYRLIDDKLYNVLDLIKGEEITKFTYEGQKIYTAAKHLQEIELEEASQSLLDIIIEEEKTRQEKINKEQAERTRKRELKWTLEKPTPVLLEHIKHYMTKR